MKIYVAGPMRGYAQFNFPAFNAAAKRLRDLGHEVFNPAERDATVGFDPTEMDGDENLADLGFSLREALAADTEYIATHADAIAVLDGWESSSGARAEVALAHALGLQVAAADRFDEHGAFTDPIVSALPASGEIRTTSQTGGQKGSKPQRYDLIPTEPLRLLATLYGNGAEKYEDNNWRKGYDWKFSYAALQRHLNQFWAGEDIDPEMQVPHVINAAWHCFTLAQFMIDHPDFDSRVKNV